LSAWLGSKVAEVTAARLRISVVPAGTWPGT